MEFLRTDIYNVNDIWNSKAGRSNDLMQMLYLNEPVGYNSVHWYGYILSMEDFPVLTSTIEVEVTGEGGKEG